MSAATGKKAVLQLDGKEIELPIYSGTLGPDVIDVKDVLASGHFTFDPGFWRQRLANLRSHSLMVTKVCYYTVAIRLIN